MKEASFSTRFRSRFHSLLLQFEMLILSYTARYFRDKAALLQTTKLASPDDSHRESIRVLHTVARLCRLMAADCGARLEGGDSGLSVDPLLPQFPALTPTRAPAAWLLLIDACEAWMKAVGAKGWVDGEEQAKQFEDVVTDLIRNWQHMVSVFTLFLFKGRDALIQFRLVTYIFHAMCCACRSR